MTTLFLYVFTLLPPRDSLLITKYNLTNYSNQIYNEIWNSVHKDNNVILV